MVECDGAACPIAKAKSCVVEMINAALESGKGGDMHIILPPYEKLICDSEHDAGLAQLTVRHEEKSALLCHVDCGRKVAELFIVFMMHQFSNRLLNFTSRTAVVSLLKSSSGHGVHCRESNRSGEDDDASKVRPVRAQAVAESLQSCTKSSFNMFPGQQFLTHPLEDDSRDEAMTSQEPPIGNCEDQG